MPEANPPTAVVTRLYTLIETGGPVVAILLGLSVLALAIVLLKLWQFAASRALARRETEAALNAWREGDEAAALAKARAARGPLAMAVATAMAALGEQGLGDEIAREEAQRVAAEELDGLRSYLRGLEVIGVLSPLLGLLGTVIGMIEAFRQLEAAGNQVDPAILSGGIWQALLTTAVGLAVAIPAMACLHLLERTVDRLRQRMESALTRVFTQRRQPATSGADAPPLAEPPRIAGHAR